MEHYIDKDALVAEIERWIELITNQKNQEGVSQIDKLSLGGRIAELQEVKSFLDTLGVKEMQEEPVSEDICNQCEAYNDKDKCDELVFGHNCPIVTTSEDLEEAFEEYFIGNADKHVFGMEYRKLDMKDAFKTGWNKCINKMKQYPSIWITKIQENEWNISVKLRADMKPVSYTKSSKEEAIKFCNEYYGGYTSIKEVI